MVSAAVTRRGFLTRPLSSASDVIYPPGATAQSMRNCSGCGDCAAACPTKIIDMRTGIPVVNFEVGECTFCGQCAERCPEGVFPDSPPTSFPHVVAIGADCLALNYVDCQSCRDACVPLAIRFRPRLGGPFVPELQQDACTGCGACLSICPTQALTVKQREAEVANG